VGGEGFSVCIYICLANYPPFSPFPRRGKREKTHTHTHTHTQQTKKQTPLSKAKTGKPCLFFFFSLGVCFANQTKQKSNTIRANQIKKGRKNKIKRKKTKTKEGSSG
jgi:hypothetical protein